MTRKKMIQQLLDSDIQDIQQEGSNNTRYFITMVLTNGWKGYNQMTDKELLEEYQNRELTDEEESK